MRAWTYLVAQVRFSQGSRSEALIWAQRAADQARRTGDEENLGSALMSIGQAEWQLGVVGDGEHFREALDIFVSIGDLPSEAVALASLAVLRFERRTLGRSSRAGSSPVGRQHCVQAGTSGAAEADMNIGEILITQGRLGEGEEVVRSAMRVLRSSGGAFMSVYGEQLLARIELARGNALEAEKQASDVVRAFIQLGSPSECTRSEPPAGAGPD